MKLSDTQTTWKCMIQRDRKLLDSRHKTIGLAL